MGRCGAKVLSVVLGLGAVVLAFWKIELSLRAQEAASARSRQTPVAMDSPLAGSASCRECHQQFYELWSTSHHGLAMQPFTPTLARTQLTGPAAEITVGKATYRAELDQSGGWIRERSPAGEKKYPIVDAMGGKNVFYFLTPLERGRLQVLPLAYDVRKKQWFDTAASAMRHFGAANEVLDWRDPMYTFNTSCYACHVSQLSSNYDLKSDSYHTTWAEPGINCETCHGPSAEHVELFKRTPAGEKPKDIRIISVKAFTAEQHNSACAPCHAKMAPITNTFKPGDRYFDHFDLVTLENPDFYPDGRDLGENYTYTGWRMNPCAIAGKLHCVHCHTSSGRFRFKDRPNDACLPCHEARVKDPAPHTHHAADSTGSQCIACHMPMTEFSRMRRSDHSLRPPAPAATVAFKSPNACNICHADRDAAWADREVRSWHKDDYQKPILERAALIAAARQGDWKRLPEMIREIGGARRDEVVATSLIRLLGTCEDERKWPALLAAMKDPSPLVRSAAASGLAGYAAPEAVAALLGATEDSYRLVRIRAADALAGYPKERLGEKDRARLDKAAAELKTSFAIRPDDWASHYNLANYLADRGQLAPAVEAYQVASRLRPDAIMPYVNAALVYARQNDEAKAEESLNAALRIEPSNAPAHFNLGLLKAQQGDAKAAEQHLRAAVKSDPKLSAAAYNLAVLLGSDRMAEAIDWCAKAHELSPGEPKYAYTLAYFLTQSGRLAEAAPLLRKVIEARPDYLQAYGLLGAIYERAHRYEEAAQVYRKAMARPELPEAERAALQRRIEAMSQ